MENKDKEQYWKNKEKEQLWKAIVDLQQEVMRQMRRINKLEDTLWALGKGLELTFRGKPEKEGDE